VEVWKLHQKGDYCGIQNIVVLPVYYSTLISIQRQNKVVGHLMQGLLTLVKLSLGDWECGEEVQPVSVGCNLGVWGKVITFFTSAATVPLPPKTQQGKKYPMGLYLSHISYSWQVPSSHQLLGPQSWDQHERLRDHAGGKPSQTQIEFK
jgi:hypothetical protein